MTARCTCYGGHICPAHDHAIDEAEWERGARDNDPEPHFAQPDDITGDWLGYEPDYFWPRDLAPIGWP